MQHRLLHSLVVSSVFLLDVGCGSSHVVGDDDGGPAPDGGGVDAAREVRDAAPTAPDAQDAVDAAAIDDAAVNDDATLVADAAEAIDAAPEVDAAPEPIDVGLDPDAAMDPRLCESGWPTTKGYICTPTTDPLRSVCCRFEDTEPCCLAVREAE